MSEMWLYPPIVGQKVTLDPTSSSYEEFKRLSRGHDAYIIKIDNSKGDFMINRNEIYFKIMWEDGRTVDCGTKVMIPLNTFKEVERLKMKSGRMVIIYDNKTKQYLDERIIYHSDSIVDDISSTKEKRIAILEKHIAWFEGAGVDTKQNADAQMRYAGTLEELERTKRQDAELLFIEASEDEGKHLRNSEQELQQTHSAFHSDDSVVQRILHEVASSPTVNLSHLEQSLDMLSEGEDTDTDTARRYPVRGHTPYNASHASAYYSAYDGIRPGGEIVEIPPRTAQGTSYLHTFEMPVTAVRALQDAGSVRRAPFYGEPVIDADFMRDNMPAEHIEQQRTFIEQYEALNERRREEERLVEEWGRLSLGSNVGFNTRVDEVTRTWDEIMDEAHTQLRGNIERANDEN